MEYHTQISLRKTRNDIYAGKYVRTSSSTPITPFQLAVVCNFIYVVDIKYLLEKQSPQKIHKEIVRTWSIIHRLA